VAGLAALLALVVGVVVWSTTRSHEYVAPRPAAPTVSADPVGAGRALRDLVDRVRSGDASSAGIAGTVVRNAAALHVTDFTARYITEDGGVQADGSWTAEVSMTWQFAGFDARRVSEEVAVGFGRGGHGVTITGFGGSGGRTPVWLSGPVHVRRTDDTLVVVRGGAAEAAKFDRLARTAVATVRRVIPWQRPRLVLEVPAGEAGLEAALAADPDSYRDVAAVTTTVDGSTDSADPVHVFVNPDVIGTLDSVGAQVVVSHEATHAATGAATNSHLPMWLSEGFADYVALRDVRLPLSTTAGQILAQVREHGPPAHLPGQAEFNAQSSQFGAEYEAAWLACRTLGELGGQRALVSLYDRVAAGRPLDATMRAVFGFGVGEFTTTWQRRLSDLAS
jgi:hypothetical protein